jgi:CubicO group peptidase (beta-lactamase class C family)
LAWSISPKIDARHGFRLPQVGRGHSLAAAIVVKETPDVALVEGQVYWGGLAGTKWFFSPREDLAAVLMTQRYMGSDLPYWPAFLRALREDLHVG